MVLLAFDYGSKRIGMAAIGGEYTYPTAVKTFQNTERFYIDLKYFVNRFKPQTIIVGLPRNLDGEETDQTKLCREFAKRLEEYKVPVVLQDETLSSERANTRLKQLTLKERRKKLDSMAAQIILEDYIRDAA